MLQTLTCGISVCREKLKDQISQLYKIDFFLFLTMNTQLLASAIRLWHDAEAFSDAQVERTKAMFRGAFGITGFERDADCDGFY